MKHVAVVNGKHACYTTTNGINRHYLGCGHDMPRQAITHTVPVYVSPSRFPGELPAIPPTDGRYVFGDGQLTEDSGLPAADL